MSTHSERRIFLKSFFTFLFAYFSWPRRVLAQIIPFAYWKRPQISLWVWGVNTYGQLGTGNRTTYSSPVQVAGSWLQVNSAWSTEFSPQTAFSLGVRTNGTLWAWGDNLSGELGQGTHTGQYSSPVQITGSWLQATCGGQGWGLMFGMGIRSDRTLWAWGNGGNGNLGQNNTTNYSSPVQIMPGTSWAYISGGYVNWMGIQTNGTLWTCGLQGAGELGLGTLTTQYNSPVQVGGSWVQAMTMCDTSAGGFSGGIKTDGSLWMWGGNGNGDLGLSNTNIYSYPAQVGSSSWSQLALSSGSNNGSHALAVQTNGTLWAWGANGTGQLGQSDLVDRSSPTQIPGTWRSAFAIQTAGGATSYAIRNDGTLWAWGDNSSGCFGTSNLNSYSSPVQVGSSGWAFINGGQSAGMGLK